MRHSLGATLVIVLTMIVGCSTPATSRRETDTTLARYSKAGNQAYAEGDVDDAIREYRSAILRAWALDDPYESGTGAYNLAACLTSKSEIAQAKDWLLDARIELCRAGSSAGNVWLLESKIARDECRFDDAMHYVYRAECSVPPCDQRDNACLCGPSNPCQQNCVTRIPCVGERIASRRSTKDCESGFQAQIHLARATLAAEQYDISTAQAQFECACELVKKTCNHSLQAELQHVAALIHLASGQFLSAAWHFDNEAKHLRLAGNYREIPTALNLAAEAFEQAGRDELATSRMCRIARIWLGRGDAREAWRHLQVASEIARATACESATIQLTLVAREIQRVMNEQDQSLDQMIETPSSLSSSHDKTLSQIQPIDCAIGPRTNVGIGPGS